MGNGAFWFNLTASRLGWSSKPSLEIKEKEKSNLVFKSFKNNELIGYYDKSSNKLYFYYWFNNIVYGFVLNFDYNTYFSKNFGIIPKIHQIIDETTLFNHLIFIDNNIKKLQWINSVIELENIFQKNYNYQKQKESSSSEFILPLNQKPDSIVKYITSYLLSLKN